MLVVGLEYDPPLVQVDALFCRKTPQTISLGWLRVAVVPVAGVVLVPVPVLCLSKKLEVKTPVTSSTQISHCLDVELLQVMVIVSLVVKVPPPWVVEAILAPWLENEAVLSTVQVLLLVSEIEDITLACPFPAKMNKAAPAVAFEAKLNAELPSWAVRAWAYRSVGVPSAI